MNRLLICTVLAPSLTAAICPVTVLSVNNYDQMVLLQTQVGLHRVVSGPVWKNASNSIGLEQNTANAEGVVEAAVEEFSWIMGIAFPLIWCFMLGSSPFILAFLHGDALSWRGKVSCYLVTCWIIFGIITCKWALFSSTHFEGNRNLTLIEATYFMSQIITTVGYGDITPADTSGQILVAILVMWAILIVADKVSRVASIVSMRLDEAARSESKDPATVQKAHLFAAVCAHLVVCIAWVTVLTFAYGWTMGSAVFSSVITLSSVGLGMTTPHQKGAQIFASFWMLIGTASMGNVVSAFGGLMKALTDDAETEGDRGGDCMAAMLMPSPPPPPPPSCWPCWPIHSRVEETSRRSSP